MSQKLKYILTFITIASCCFFYSCLGWDPFNKCDSGGYNFLVHNDFYFQILNKKTKENVLLIGQIDYNYDTVKIYHENWSAISPWRVPHDGNVSLPFLDYDDVGVIDQNISKRFFMYFNYQDIDTIDIAYKTKYDECHIQSVVYFKIAYNDSIYFDGTTGSGNQRPPYLSILKKY